MLLVGQAIVDVSYPSEPEKLKLRLGGIAHAARTAWAAGIAFDVAYISPDYLAPEAERYLSALGARTITRIGIVDGSPNTVLIGDPSEAGAQGYEWVLGDDRAVTIDRTSLADVLAKTSGPVLMFPDETDIGAYAAGWPGCSALLAVDSALGVDDVMCLRPSVVISSTSSMPTRVAPADFAERALVAGADTVLIKENRGGARCWNNGGVHQVGAVSGSTVHGVGVGDAYDVAFLAELDAGVGVAMARAALVATNYASTTDPDVLARLVAASIALSGDDVIALPGEPLAWEDRAGLQVYVAAPDFDWVDTRTLDQLEAALAHHGFASVRPVQVNGQVDVADRAACATAFEADRSLIDGSALLVVVLLFNDPGSLLEAGYAIGRGIPVVLWDPSGRFDNVWLWNLPTARATTLEEVVAATFRILGAHRA